MKLQVILIGCLLLGGCATSGAMQQAVGIDTFCLQPKRTWSINDTPQTVRDARVFNETLDRRCGVKKS